MERYQVRTVKALLEDLQTFSISSFALSTAQRCNSSATIEIRPKYARIVAKATTWAHRLC
jgi:hypothetical protein